MTGVILHNIACEKLQEAPYAFKIFFLSVLLILQLACHNCGPVSNGRRKHNGAKAITPVAGVGRESLQTFNLAAKIVEPQGINGLFLLYCNRLNTAKRMKQSIILEFGIALKAVHGLQCPNATCSSSTWTFKAFSSPPLRISLWVLWDLCSFSVCFFSPSHCFSKSVPQASSDLQALHKLHSY